MCLSRAPVPVQLTETCVRRIHPAEVGKALNRKLKRAARCLLFVRRSAEHHFTEEKVFLPKFADGVKGREGWRRRREGEWFGFAGTHTLAFGHVERPSLITQTVSTAAVIEPSNHMNTHRVKSAFLSEPLSSFFFLVFHRRRTYRVVFDWP